MSADDDRCESCGTLLFERGEDGKLDRRHQVGGGHCRVFAWDRKARELGLMRVPGDVSTELNRLGFEFTYGPVAHLDPDTGRWRLASGAFGPRWGVYLVEALGTSPLGWGDLSMVAITARGLKEEHFRDALLSTGDLFEVPSERRIAVVELLRAEFAPAVLARTPIMSRRGTR